MSNYIAQNPPGKGLRVSALKNLGNPQPSCDHLPDGAYDFLIMAATACKTKTGRHFAKFGLAVLHGPMKHKRTLVNCFATDAKGFTNEHGLGTLGENVNDLNRLVNLEIEGVLCGTYVERTSQAWQKLKILSCLSDRAPAPIAGAA